MDVSLTFIGAGNANSQDLGNACARLLIDGKELLIDFGFTAYNQYKSEFKGVPEAIFITHTHLDHIGGLQALFFDAYLSKKKVTLFVPVPLISSIHRILASEENLLSEGGANFWDAFNLIPVSDNFWFHKARLLCFQVEHHSYQYGHGLAMTNRFTYTGDTRPVPATLRTVAPAGPIFHDLSLVKQPSHTHLDELCVYEEDQLDRMVFYHLANLDQVKEVEQAGYRVALPGKRFTL
ncbi:MBL fold metallo-hydrolase [Candidatus Poribacteria bacterium]|nr:MBL fold metallo-hydrolase [Candidatus Poribacteria bacterium]MCP4260563.1 MBL fold metallo-hydrolase [Planctomycetota bacterium]